MLERDAWAEVATARAPALLRLAVMLTGDPHQAEDLVQDTLARATRHGDRIAAMDAPAAYLRTVLVREHVSWHRRLQRRPVTRTLQEQDPSPEAAPGERLAIHDAVWRLLATLPTRQRAVLALRYYEDLTDPEIAEVLGCSPATVRSHASRALAALRTHLTDRPDQSDPSDAEESW